MQQGERLFAEMWNKWNAGLVENSFKKSSTHCRKLFFFYSALKTTLYTHATSPWQ